MKVMIYGPREQSEVLCHEVYKGLDYGIINRGTHPCCYVECTDVLLDRINKIPDDETYFLIEPYEKANDLATVHGGFTFFGPLHRLNSKKNYLGWDYAHYGDRVAGYGGYGGCSGKEWTTEELVRACKDCIDELLEFSFREENHE